MTSSAYRYKFRDEANLLEAESTLHVAILAAEGLFGEARVRMDAGYVIDPSIRTLVVDASTAVGQVVCGIFTALVLREFGQDAFNVRRVEGGADGACRGCRP